MGNVKITLEEYNSLIETSMKYEMLISAIVESASVRIFDWSPDKYELELNDKFIIPILKAIDRKGFDSLFDACLIMAKEEQAKKEQAKKEQSKMEEQEEEDE